MAGGGIIILKCTCKDEYQDKHYGAAMRVHNKSFTKGKEMGNGYCTVCGKKTPYDIKKEPAKLPVQSQKVTQKVPS